jgi:hypothetical protein
VFCCLEREREKPTRTNGQNCCLFALRTVSRERSEKRTNKVSTRSGAVGVKGKRGQPKKKEKRRGRGNNMCIFFLFFFLGGLSFFSLCICRTLSPVFFSFLFFSLGGKKEKRGMKGEKEAASVSLITLCKRKHPFPKNSPQ